MLVIKEQDSILERWKNRRADELIAMHNKDPAWNEGNFQNFSSIQNLFQ